MHLNNIAIYLSKATVTVYEKVNFLLTVISDIEFMWNSHSATKKAPGMVSSAVRKGRIRLKGLGLK